MTWRPAELAVFDSEDELEIASYRADGSLRPFVTIWAVRVGPDTYVRSARHTNPWFRRALASGRARIRIGGVSRDVAVETASDVGEELDAAYHAKYDRYGPAVVGGVVGAASHDRTIRLVPTS